MLLHFAVLNAAFIFASAPLISTLKRSYVRAAQLSAIETNIVTQVPPTRGQRPAAMERHSVFETLLQLLPDA